MTEGGSFCRYKRAHSAVYFHFCVCCRDYRERQSDNVASKFLHTHPPGGRVGARFDNDCIGVGEVAKLASVNVQLTNTFSSIIPQLPRDGQSRCSFLFSRYRGTLVAATAAYRLAARAYKYVYLRPMRV